MIGRSQDIFYSFHPGKNETFESLQATGGQYKIVSNDKDIVAQGADGNSVKNLLHKFSGFSSMEDEDNFIYPFLAKRKTTNYNGQGGRQSAYSIADQLYNLPSRVQNLENSSHPFSKEYKSLTEDILGFTPGKVPGSQSGEDKLGIFARSRDSIYLESMGDGVANILGMLTILLTEDRKLFLIEEIENDIHPEALKKNLSIIIGKSKFNQFIITTHSNIVLKYLASIPETKIFYTDWEHKEFGGRNKFLLPNR